MNPTDAMIAISCKCPTCKINAEKIGASFPLKAEVPSALAAVVKSSTARHSFVYDAHSSSPVAAAVRARTGLRPVA